MGLQLSTADGGGGPLDRGVLDAWMAEFAVDTKTITKAEFASVLSRWDARSTGATRTGCCTDVIP